MSRHVGYPRDNKAGYPPSESAVTRSSISRDMGSVIQHRSAVVDEQLAAAWCQMRHGDPYLPDDTSAALKGRSDLIGRTWRKSQEMSRDERRLLARYEKTITAYDAEMVRRYRECTLCAPSHGENQ